MSDEINHWICFLYLKLQLTEDGGVTRYQRADSVSSCWTVFRSCSEVQIQYKYSVTHRRSFNSYEWNCWVSSHWTAVRERKALFICSLRRFLYLFTWQRSWDGLTGSLDVCSWSLHQNQLFESDVNMFSSCICGKTTTKKHDVFVFVSTKPDVSHYNSRFLSKSCLWLRETNLWWDVRTSAVSEHMMLMRLWDSFCEGL